PPKLSGQIEAYFSIRTLAQDQGTSLGRQFAEEVDTVALDMEDLLELEYGAFSLELRLDVQDHALLDDVVVEGQRRPFGHVEPSAMADARDEAVDLAQFCLAP